VRRGARRGRPDRLDERGHLRFRVDLRDQA
jgi:hypothetical protein